MKEEGLDERVIFVAPTTSSNPTSSFLLAY